MHLFKPKIANRYYWVGKCKSNIYSCGGIFIEIVHLQYKLNMAFTNSFINKCHSSVNSNNVHHRRLWHANWLLMKVLSLCNPFVSSLFPPLSHIKKLISLTERCCRNSWLPEWAPFLSLLFYFIFCLSLCVCSFNQQKTWHKKATEDLCFHTRFYFKVIFAPQRPISGTITITLK